MTAVVTRDEPRVLIQTATQLGPDENWTTQQFLTTDAYSYGQGEIIGNAVLRQDYGVVYGPDPSEPRNLGIVPDLERSGLGSIAGNFVRICKEDSSGTITAQIAYLNSQGQTLFETVRYAPVWYGIVHGPSISINGAAAETQGGIVTWQCGGLAECFAQYQLMFYYVIDDATDKFPGTFEIYRYLPVFNADGRANRSSSTFTLNGRAVYLHALSQTDPTALWTAKQILDTIIAGFVVPMPSAPIGHRFAITCGINLDITGDVGALAYTPTDYDASGKSILNVFNELISSRRGLTWFLHPQSDGSVNLVVTSIRDGAFGIVPATSLTGSLTVAGNPWLADVNIQQDDSGTADLVRVNGDMPYVGLQLDYPIFSSGALGLSKGWTTDQESAWVGFQSVPGTENVFQRFWVGRESAEGDLHIDSLAAFLPQPVNEDVDGPESSSQELPRQKALVFLQTSGGWEDVTKLCRVTIDNNPPAVSLDFGDDGVTIRNQIAADLGIRVTVGANLNRLSFAQVYTADSSVPAIPTRAGWRVRGAKVAAKYHRMSAGVMIATDDGTAVTTPSEVAYLDERQQIEDVAEMIAAAASGFLYRASWTDRGRALTAFSGDDYAPGYSITISDIPGCRVVVTRRTVVREDGHWNTEIEAETIAPKKGARL